VESDPTRTCELLVGLPDLNVLSIDDFAGEPLRVHVETRCSRPGCRLWGASLRRPVGVAGDNAQRLTQDRRRRSTGGRRRLSTSPVPTPGHD
jgi:hypothetical protein